MPISVYNEGVVSILFSVDDVVSPRNATRVPAVSAFLENIAHSVYYFADIQGGTANYSYRLPTRANLKAAMDTLATHPQTSAMIVYLSGALGPMGLRLPDGDALDAREFHAWLREYELPSLVLCDFAASEQFAPSGPYIEYTAERGVVTQQHRTSELGADSIVYVCALDSSFLDALTCWWRERGADFVRKSMRDTDSVTSQTGWPCSYADWMSQLSPRCPVRAVAHSPSVLFETRPPFKHLYILTRFEVKRGVCDASSGWIDIAVAVAAGAALAYGVYAIAM